MLRPAVWGKAHGFFERFVHRPHRGVRDQRDATANLIAHGQIDHNHPGLGNRGQITFSDPEDGQPWSVPYLWEPGGASTVV